MDLATSLLQLPTSPLFDSLLPDFILSFLFFMALSYAVLARRFNHQRAAIAMSVSVGLALSIGLIWWLYERGWSTRQLGPVAIGFAVILLGLILFQAMRQVGGTLSGGAIAFGASLFVTALLGTVPSSGLVQALALLILLAGGGLLLVHHHPPTASHAYAQNTSHRDQHDPGRTRTTRFPRGLPFGGPHTMDRDEVKRDLSDVHVDRLVGRRLQDGLHHTRTQTDDLESHPELTAAVMAQINAMLPAEGWLTERLAKLRAHAFKVREGHIANLDQTRHLCRRLPKESRKVMASSLVAGYKKIVGIEDRLNRLDNAVAEAERRVRDATAGAREALLHHDQDRLSTLLREAEKLQKHATRLMAQIERTEKKLIQVIDHVAKSMSEAADA